VTRAHCLCLIPFTQLDTQQNVELFHATIHILQFDTREVGIAIHNVLLRYTGQENLPERYRIELITYCKYLLDNGREAFRALPSMHSNKDQHPMAIQAPYFVSRVNLYIGRQFEELLTPTRALSDETKQRIVELSQCCVNYVCMDLNPSMYVGHMMLWREVLHAKVAMIALLPNVSHIFRDMMTEPYLARLAPSTTLILRSAPTDMYIMRNTVLHALRAIFFISPPTGGPSQRGVEPIVMAFRQYLPQISCERHLIGDPILDTTTYSWNMIHFCDIAHKAREKMASRDLVMLALFLTRQIGSLYLPLWVQGICLKVLKVIPLAIPKVIEEQNKLVREEEENLKRDRERERDRESMQGKIPEKGERERERDRERERALLRQQLMNYMHQNRFMARPNVVASLSQVFSSLVVRLEGLASAIPCLVAAHDAGLQHYPCVLTTTPKDVTIGTELTTCITQVISLLSEISVTMVNCLQTASTAGLVREGDTYTFQ
ncbi:hypothetical protein KIPB_007102, partial [Kipferlia bialata]